MNGAPRLVPAETQYTYLNAYSGDEQISPRSQINQEAAGPGVVLVKIGADFTDQRMAETSGGAMRTR